MISARHSFRQTATSPVFVALDGAHSGAVLRDFCEEGLGLDVIGPAIDAPHVEIDFNLPNSEQHFHAIGKVIWRTDSGRKIGIQFVEVPPASHRQLRKWISPEAIPEGSRFHARSKEKSSRTEASVSYSLGPTASAGTDSDTAPPAMGAAEITSIEVASGPSYARSLTSPSRTDRNNKSPGAVGSFQEFINRQPLSTWLAAAVCVFLLVLLLFAGLWMLASPEWLHSLNFGNLRAAMLSNDSPKSNSSSPQTGSHPSKNRTNRPPKNGSTVGTAVSSQSATKPLGPNPALTKPSSNGKFEVLDSQNGRRSLPRNVGSSDVILGGAVTADIPKANTDRSTQPQVSRAPVGDVPVREVLPEYPAEALQKHIQGQVTLKVMVGKDGTLHSIQILSHPSALDSTALNAVRQWRYRPRYNDGKAFEFETQIALRFTLAPESQHGVQ